MGVNGVVLRRIALECKPKMIVAGASAYARTIDFKKFREIAVLIPCQPKKLINFANLFWKQ